MNEAALTDAGLTPDDEQPRKTAVENRFRKGEQLSQLSFAADKAGRIVVVSSAISLRSKRT